jgi:hypothetical protein
MNAIRTFLLVIAVSLLSSATYSQQSSLGDTLGAFNAGILTPTPDRNLHGVAFAEGHYWISGSDPDDSWQHKLYKITPDGQTLVQYWPQQTLTGMWKGLAYDGFFLYGAGIDTIYQINMQTGQPTGLKIPSPYYYNTGLTYDPGTDHFWVSGSGNLIYEINKSGVIVNSIAFPQDIPAVGLAWDTWTAGGPYLWVWSMKYTSSDVRPKAYQIKVSTGQLTGVNFEGVSMFPPTVDGALGWSLTDELIPGKVVFTALHSSNYQQSNDQLDWVVLYDLDPVGSGTPGPEIVVNPTSIQNNLMPGDSIDVAITVSNLSPQFDLNWLAFMEYPDSQNDEPGDTLLTFDITQLTAPVTDNGIRSLVFLNDHFYMVTYPGIPYNARLIKISKDGSAIVSVDTVAWGNFGGSALAADDSFIYGTDPYTIFKYDPITKEILEFYPKTNFSPSAMAYDPQNELFYLAGSNGVIKTINKSGSQVNFYQIPYNIRGLAWDSWSPGAPYLWAYCQTNDSVGDITAIRLNPLTGFTTGSEFEGIKLGDPGSVTEFAGDIFVTPNWQENKLVLHALNSTGSGSGGGNNFLITYDLAVVPPPDWIELKNSTVGTVQPLSSDTLFVRLKAIMEDTLMFAQLVINSNDVINPKVIVSVNFMMMPLIFTGTSDSQGIEDKSVGLLYPNPARNKVTLSLKSVDTDVQVSVYNMAGRLVLQSYYNANLQSITMDVSKLPAGLYNAVIRAGNSIEHRKLMVR